MQRLGSVELPEIACGHEDEIAVACVAYDIPVLPARAADMCDVPGFMAGALCLRRSISTVTASISL